MLRYATAATPRLPVATLRKRYATDATGEYSDAIKERPRETHIFNFRKPACFGLALPTTTSMAGYRNSHFAHHRALNGDNDPTPRRAYCWPLVAWIVIIAPGGI